MSRPSVERQDYRAIVAMASRWRPGAAIRPLAIFEIEKNPDLIYRKAIGKANKGKPIVVSKPKNEREKQEEKRKCIYSAERRLQRRFQVYHTQGKILPIAVYLFIRPQIHNLLRNESLREDTKAIQTKRENKQIALGTAVSSASEAFKMSDEHIRKLASHGLVILKNWLPNEYERSEI